MKNNLSHYHLLNQNHLHHLRHPQNQMTFLRTLNPQPTTSQYVQDL